MGVNEFWELDEYETLLVINGYQSRQDDAGQMLAHFTAYLGSVAGNWGKGKRPPKAKDLWRSREEREKDARKQRTIQRSTEGVIDLAERRAMMREFKKLEAPQIPRRPHRQD